MSIIQDIRDKYARVAVVAIALALIGFILTDYFSGRGGQGTKASNSLGSVNGITIKSDAFSKKLEIVEAQMRSQGYPASSITSQAVEQVWTEEVNRVLVEEEAKKLGMAIGKKELGDILYGAGAPEDLKRQLSDSTGYNPISAKQKIDQMLKDKNVPQEQKDNFNGYVLQLKQSRLLDKINGILSGSANYPRWFIEKQSSDNTQIAKISLVREFYSSIADSAVKVEDKEIAEYVNKYKKDFKQEESRSISYVSFNASPSAKDSIEIRSKLQVLKPEMDTTKEVAAFLSRNGVYGFTETYMTATQLGAAKDSIQKLAKNQVYGPYIDGPTYAMTKLLDTRTMPDTVTCRHILISTTQIDPNTRQQTQIRDTTTAYNLCDSVRKEIAKGVSFDSLVVKFSEDQGSKDKGGVYESVYYGQMVPTFNDFIFLNPVGSKGIVKTEFGYHYIEVIQQKGNSPAYKIARISSDIFASAETDNAAMEEANQFAADSKDLKGFDEQFEKTQKAKGRVKGTGQNIKPNDGMIQGVGYSRQFVRNIYSASHGEVLKPERIDDNYVVAVVTAVYKEGTMDPATARQVVEPVLRNEKKAALIKNKIGKATTLEAAAAALGGKSIETVDSVRMNSSGSLGYEPRVSGAAFNPANKGKVVPEPLEGLSGVFFIRVENTSATPSTAGDITEQRNAKYQQSKMFSANTQAPTHPLNVLKKVANIKDKRASRY